MRLAMKSSMRIIDSDDVPFEAEIDEYEEVDEEGPVIVAEDGGDTHPEELKRLKLSNYDSDDSSPVRCKLQRSRKRYDSDDETRQNNKSKKKKKEKRRSYDSDDEISDKVNSNKRTKRYDSDDESKDIQDKGSVLNRKRERPSKMSSGHSAGLQSATEFRKAESAIQGLKKKDKKDLDRGSTVYRDKDGKILLNSKNSSESSELNLENDGKWNIGTKQRQEAIDYASERYAIGQSTFARSVEDVDKYMRDIARNGDPMAKQPSLTSDYRAKKLYAGPPPKPNRYNIRPGYRWDGVDRGNGFEDKVLAKVYGKKSRDEERYKVSCADM